MVLGVLVGFSTVLCNKSVGAQVLVLLLVLLVGVLVGAAVEQVHFPVVPVVGLVEKVVFMVALLLLQGKVRLVVMV